MPSSSAYARWLRPGCLLLAAVLVLAGAAGCRRGVPQMVPVRGRVTLAGKAWPKAGIVNFAPLNPAEGMPRKPGSAEFDADGTFAAKTGDYPGLIPGEYRVSISCWERPPEDNDPGKSYVPEEFSSPAKSKLDLKVPAGSGPIVWEQDFPRAK
jgi:hypothetical protein